MGPAAKGQSDMPIQPILDTAVDGIIIIDAAGTIQLFNRAAEQMFGYTAIEVIGRNVKVLMPAPFDKEHDCYLENYFATGVKRIIGIGREVVALRRDGSTFPVELAVGEVHDRPNLRFVGFVRDISEKKQLERRSLRAQRLESIGTLVGGIAHDLNNVLTPILMSIRLLQKPQSAEVRDELLATAQASVERGTALIKQLLTFAGGSDANKSALLLTDTIREVRSLLEHTVPKSIAIDVHIPNDIWPILGDATQLAQIVMNFCVNARDAMPNGGTLTIAAANVSANQPLPCLPTNLPSGRYVRLSVADTGTGIHPDVLDKIFDPFFTTKEFGRGTGLGLSTALGIVRGHNGGINVYSELGFGTRITVYLPAIGQDSANEQAQRATATPEGRGETILLVDDEEPIRIAARHVLQSAGYHVITAVDGAEAIEKYRIHAASIRAVILDLMMPNLDGAATLVELGKLNPLLPVITASGLRPNDRAIGQAMIRPRAFLQKPYSDEELLTTLAEVLSE